MKALFKRHRVRATFYNIILIASLIVAALTFTHIISDRTGLIATLVLIFIDYLAEMYDPNPKAPGKWFSRHFKRIWEDDDEYN